MNKLFVVEYWSHYFKGYRYLGEYNFYQSIHNLLEYEDGMDKVDCDIFWSDIKYEHEKFIQIN